MKQIRLALLLLMGLLLAACLAEQEESNRQLGSHASQGGDYLQEQAATARVEFAVHLPGDASAAYIDTENTRSIKVQVFEAGIAGFDVESGQATETLRNYISCLAQNYLDPESTEAINLCGQFPAGRMSAPIDSVILTADQTAAGFNLIPDRNYAIHAAQYNSADPTGLMPLAWTTTYITPDDGNNAVDLNLIYGSWQFGADTVLQLLNRDTYAFGAFKDADGDSLGEELPDWWLGSSEVMTTPAMALGMAPAADVTVNLDTLHLKAYPEFSSSEQGFYSEESRTDVFWEENDLFEFYTPLLLSPHQPLLQTQVSGDYYFVEPTYIEDYGSDSSTSIRRGVIEPATLIQQYDPTQATQNRHRLGLGTWEVSIEEDMGSGDAGPRAIEVFAGLMLASEENDVLEILRKAGREENANYIDVREPVFRWMVPAILPESELVVAYYDIDSNQAQLLTDSDTGDFSAIDSLEPFQLTAQDRMEGSLIEYVGYINMEDSFQEQEYPILAEDEDGNFEQEGSVSVEVFAVSSASSAGSAKASASAQIARHLKLNHLAEQQGLVTASAASGCFVLELSYQSISSFYVFDQEQSLWLPAAPEYGYWYQAEDGSYFRDEEGDIFTVGTGASPSETQQDDEGVIYYLQPTSDDGAPPGIIGMDTSEQALADTCNIMGRGQGEVEVCIQPVSLTAGPYSDPRDTAEGDIEIR